MRTQPDGGMMAVDDPLTTTCAIMTFPFAAPDGVLMLSAVLPAPLFAVAEFMKVMPDG